MAFDDINYMTFIKQLERLDMIENSIMCAEKKKQNELFFAA